AIVSQIMPQQGKVFAIQQLRQQSHQFPAHALFVKGALFGDFRVLPEIPKESAFNKQSMSWKLMTLLPQLLDREDFTLLRHYLTDDSDKRKLFQLSSKAADLFDQYLVYRPDWLAQ
ncbi:exodeoxyribonuclease V subunit gamma, partial [Pseudomonas aeruginosa]|uniref:exodeoxyribonuclease V subunit gamma n=1 Tax=Pseudomonas aeruginosa TaxID=287 RepID=UPI003CF159E7